MDKDTLKETRDAIILKTLPHVSFDGWTWEVVLLGAEEAGYDKQAAGSAFPEQIIDVLDGFSYMADRAMIAALEGKNPVEMRIRDRVRAGVLARFEYLQPHKDAVRQSMKFWAVPFRKPRGAKMVWRTADHIWNWAGDESADYNRYTKRGLLSGVIVSTTFAWLNDGSEDMDETRVFLDNRIENVMQLGKVIGRFKRAS